MKKFVLSFGLALAMPVMVNAQGFMKKLEKLEKFAGSADSLGVWKDATSYMIEGPGSVIMKDGTKEEGTVQLNVTEYKTTLTYIYFTPASQMKPIKMTDDEILSFTVKGKDFYPIRMKEDDASIGNRTIFMEMLNGSPNDKFRMYRLRKLEKETMQNASRPYSLNRGFYVMLPEFKNAHEIVDLTFTPFAKKMSNYLKDCPELAKKIEDKEKGYKYNMFNGAANDEVFFRIMEEYNACEKQ